MLRKMKSQKSKKCGAENNALLICVQVAQVPTVFHVKDQERHSAAAVDVRTNFYQTVPELLLPLVDRTLCLQLQNPRRWVNCSRRCCHCRDLWGLCRLSFVPLCWNPSSAAAATPPSSSSFVLVEASVGTFRFGTTSPGAFQLCILGMLPLPKRIPHNWMLVSLLGVNGLHTLRNKVKVYPRSSCRRPFILSFLFLSVKKTSW